MKLINDKCQKAVIMLLTGINESNNSKNWCHIDTSLDELVRIGCNVNWE